MRLLSALVLTQCFSCVFSEDTDDAVKYKNIYTSKMRKNMLKRNPYTSVDNIKESRYTQNEKNMSIAQGSHEHFRNSKNFKRGYRRLLSYPENGISRDIMTNKQLLRTTSQIRNAKKIAVPEEHEKDIETHNELWDDWSNWSACSVSCGSGRQVRWRHCLAENCSKGLKKAQIKACRLKDCNPNILNWLGIKKS